MLSEASSLVRHKCTCLPKYQCSQRPRPWLRHKCTRQPKYRCSQRPRPWLDTSAHVCPSIGALRGLVPGYTQVHTSAQVSMLSEASSLVKTQVHTSTQVSMLSEASSLVRHQCTRRPKYRCSQRPRPWLDTSALVDPSIDALRGLVPG